MSPKIRELLRFDTVVALVLVGSLVTVGAGVTARILNASSPPPELVGLDDIPDRFVELTLNPDAGEGARAKREEGKAGKKDARMAKAKGNEVEMDREIAERAGVLGALSDKSKLLSGLIGTRGSGGGTADGLGVAAALGEASNRGAEGDPVSLRAWFPETFLWAPAVLTDAAGEASLSVQLPDQLGRFRVLGLSAAQDGSVSGAAVEIETALDSFVEPVLPSQLRQGDRLMLTVRVGNRGQEALHAALAVGADGLVGGGRTQVSLAPGAEQIYTVPLQAGLPGEAMIAASLTGHDATQRPLRVIPTGEPDRVELSGLLGGRVELPLTLSPDATYARLDLQILPGPVGFVQAELAAGSRGAGLPERAAAAFLGATGPALLEALGQAPDEADRVALRALRLRATPALLTVQGSRSKSDQALALLALRAAGEDPLAGPRAALLTDALRQAQRPDGSFAVPDSSTLQHLVATTAWLAGVLDEPAVSARASAVVERFAPALLDAGGLDPYTPALVLASGLADPDLAARLSAKARADLQAISEDPTLLPRLLRPDGEPATLADLRIAAGRAGLDGVEALRALSDWSPSTGLGSGFTTVEALRMLAGVGVSAEQTFTVRVEAAGWSEELRVSSRAPLVELQRALPPGTSQITLSTDAANTGLSWRAGIASWRPWKAAPNPSGLALLMDHGPAKVGERVPVELRITAPAEGVVTAEIALPAGVEVIEDSLEGATWRQVEAGALAIELPIRRAAVQEVRFEVVPTAAGRLQSGAARVLLEGQEAWPAVVVPETWEIAG